MTRRAAVVHPAKGYPTSVILAGCTWWVWWGPNEEGVDVVAAEGGRVLAFSAETALMEAARSRGWARAPDQSVASVIDVRPVESWVGHRTTAVPLEAVLNLWNFVDDINVSTSGDLLSTGRVADRLHRKLTASAVPWLFGLDGYDPRWSAFEFDQLSRISVRAIAILRRMPVVSGSVAAQTECR